MLDIIITSLEIKITYNDFVKYIYLRITNLKQITIDL